MKKTNPSIKELRISNPPKFLEILPNLLVHNTIDKLTSLGIDERYFTDIKNHNNLSIDKKIKSSYNLSSISIGAFILTVGMFLYPRIIKNKDNM